ncbi:MAG: hypothetical protein FJ405_00910 [Verrucomicrobia bacterium]|nr:hypothetical protein [Verrucomicrobiota bacterium]
MSRLRNISIRAKLMFFGVGTSALSLAIALVLLGFNEWQSFERENSRQMTVLAGVISENCRPAIEFDRPEDAATILASLAQEGHVVDAAIFNAQGNYFSA